jgi:hypothetical protein
MSTTLARTLRTTAELAPHASDFRVEKEKRSIFAFITSALHCSRRIQARRILRQYEHLIAHPEERLPHESAIGTPL